MPKLKINGVEINYSLDGTGEETIVFLNGIMMNTLSWNDFVPVLTEQNSYRLLRLDFRDMGFSSPYTEDYDVSIHVDDLKGLLDELGIRKVHLLGVSYGAMVAMMFALKYPENLSTLILPNAVARVTRFLQAASDIWEYSAATNSGELFFKLSMPFIYSDEFYERNWEWLKEREAFFDQILTKEYFASLQRLSRSSKNFDILDEIHKIKVPTLLIAGSRDIITPVSEMKKIQERIEGSRMIIIEGAGHASFYEKMDEFVTAVLGFVALHRD
ncbi:MAG: alpha/beta hydrolase [Bacillota bacterium]|jgi:pimeloyl-ACP methyl ester carboxylesterase|nr:alpha/beta hydrolase [Bacillota bacterium]